MARDEQDPSASTSASLDESTLAQSTERYASMFTHHPHAVYSVDAEGFFTDANDRGLEMTGLSLEQVRASHFADIIHPDDLTDIETAFAGTLAGEPQVVHARVVRTDGGLTDIRCTAIPVVVSGEVVGVHGVAEDVTETNRLLRQLEEANAAKTLFLATVSHEVRTPLAALVGASDLLLQTSLDPEPLHLAHIVHRSGERLMRVADDILEFSGLESHQTVLRREPVDLPALVEDLACWATPLAQARGLSLTVRTADGVPRVCVGDGRRISQVVTNLVHNAIAYTEHGSVDVRVSSRPSGEAEAGTWLEFEVRDTGIGIAERHLPHVLLPFVQADPMVDGDRQGVGLGLAISRNLADLMGGRLTIASTLGTGTTVTFGFPLACDGDETVRR